MESDRIPPHHARFGRDRAVVAVVAASHRAEVTDVVVPYGILTASGAALSVSFAVINERSCGHFSVDFKTGWQLCQSADRTTS